MICIKVILFLIFALNSVLYCQSDDFYYPESRLYNYSPIHLKLLSRTIEDSKDKLKDISNREIITYCTTDKINILTYIGNSPIPDVISLKSYDTFKDSSFFILAKFLVRELFLDTTLVWNWITNKTDSLFSTGFGVILEKFEKKHIQIFVIHKEIAIGITKLEEQKAFYRNIPERPDKR